MKLMTVPFAILENADFREPLGDKIIILVDTGPGYRAGNFGEKIDTEFDGQSWLHWLGQFDEKTV